MQKFKLKKYSDENNDGVEIVYRSGRIYETDMVADEFEKRGIPHFRRVETISGLVLAMPFQPTQGPGEIWAIVVPRKYVIKAKDIIKEMPVSNEENPGIWAFSPTPEAKSFFKSYAYYIIIVLIAQVIGLIVMVLRR